MTKQRAMDDFMREALAHDPDADELFAALVDSLPPVEPPAALRERLFASVDTRGPLTRFAAAVARLADIAETRARELLGGLSDAVWEAGPAGTQALWVEGGAATMGCIRGFVRLGAGRTFPHHAHLGQESMLVLEGRLTDESGRVVLPGQIATMASSTAHSTTAMPGEDALYFTVIREGLTLDDGLVITHRDAP